MFEGQPMFAAFEVEDMDMKRNIILCHDKKKLEAEIIKRVNKMIVNEEDKCKSIDDYTGWEIREVEILE